jgi:hypothetical protein
MPPGRKRRAVCTLLPIIFFATQMRRTLYLTIHPGRRATKQRKLRR